LLLEIGRLESPSSLVFSMKMKIGYFSNIWIISAKLSSLLKF
jgi:hypothetical protein